jgi:hypothetical protein
MQISNNIKARNISIDSLDSSVLSRLTCNRYLSIQPIIKLKFNNIISPSLDIDININSLCKIAIDNRYRAIVTEDESVLPIPFIFKYKGKDIKSLSSYNPTHIKSSIIKTILLDGSDCIDVRADRAVAILYIYWFCNTDNGIKDITHNVCVDIESIISTIIEKGLTLYKDYTITSEVIECLREKLRSEKLLNMGDL